MLMVKQGVLDLPKLPQLAEGPARHERLARLAAERAELAKVVPFWLAIHGAQLDIWSRLAALPQPHWESRRQRFAEGQPQILFSDLRLAPESFGDEVSRLEAAWRAHDPTPATTRETAWPARAMQVFADPNRWFGQRRELPFEDALAALALAPYLAWFAVPVMHAIQNDLDAWEQGRCPACGGWPDLALLFGEPAARSLICGRCDSAWPFRRVGCPFCGDLDQQVYYPADDGKTRLDACGCCRRYLKTLQGRYLTDGLDPYVARLATVTMDVAALQAGYGPA
ncbi:MAG: formate dehydrogenase accessory protein FdhE [Anaerolineae bacterium]